MKKSKIYTKAGDEGSTGLVSGNRVSKSDHRIALYGEIDELNSRVGLVCAYIQEKYNTETLFLRTVQSALFVLGSNMACEEDHRKKFSLPQIDQNLVKEIEEKIDILDGSLPQLKHFVLPGGNLMSAHVHLARTGARNVERLLVSYQENSNEALPSFALIFLNRLSDYFFVLARYLDNKEGSAEIYWEGKN